MWIQTLWECEHYVVRVWIQTLTEWAQTPRQCEHKHRECKHIHGDSVNTNTVTVWAHNPKESTHHQHWVLQWTQCEAVRRNWVPARWQSVWPPGENDLSAHGPWWPIHAVCVAHAEPSTSRCTPYPQVCNRNNESAHAKPQICNRNNHSAYSKSQVCNRNNNKPMLNHRSVTEIINKPMLNHRSVTGIINQPMLNHRSVTGVTWIMNHPMAKPQVWSRNNQQAQVCNRNN